MGGKLIKHLTIKLKKLRAVKTWQLLLIFILLLFASATLLRLDHIKMTNLRSAVLSADKEGNEIVLADSLNNLKNFTTSHIVINIIDDNGNKKIEFGTGVFYLEQSYLTAASEILQKASEAEINDGNPNGNSPSPTVGLGTRPSTSLAGRPSLPNIPPRPPRATLSVLIFPPLSFIAANMSRRSGPPVSPALSSSSPSY